MSADWTPGPWEALADQDGLKSTSPVTICGPADDDLANVYSSNDATVNVPKAEAIANARIMAMAPELVETLADLLSGFGNTQQSFVVKARAVLARARGETQETTDA